MFAPDTRPKSHPSNLTGPALRTFFNIARLWSLNREEQKKLLGLTADSTYYKWKSNPDAARFNPDTLERISYILGIYKALQILLPDEKAADAWIRKPNDIPLFAGRPALERMLSGKVADLYTVRQYLDAQRGGWS